MCRQFAAAQPSYKYWATFGGRNGMLLTVTDENQKYIGSTIGEKVPPPSPPRYGDVQHYFRVY